MRRLMSALLALMLCTSAGLAEGEFAAFDGRQDEAESVRVDEPMEPDGAGGAIPEPAPEPPVEEIIELPDEGANEDAPAAEAGADIPELFSEDEIIFDAEESASAIEFAAPLLPIAEAGIEGYVRIGDMKLSGTLSDLLATPGEKTVYVLAPQPVEILDFELALLKGVTFLPDPDTFPGENYAVKLLSGEAEITPEQIAAATDERIALTISVVERVPDPSQIEIRVDALNYEPGRWMNWHPEFRLSGIPAGAQGYSYVAVIYDERFIPLSGDFYLPTEEGAYTLRFAILNPQGDVADISDVYELKLDFTPPELKLRTSKKRDYTLILSATDAPGGSAELSSGVAEFSLDGGESWQPLGEGERVRHSEEHRKIFPPQSILVRDLAGNAASNEEEIALDKLVDDSVPIGWGGGGGGAPSAPKPSHASGSGDTSPYDAYELSLPEGPVDALKLGEEEIDLGLQVDGVGPEPFTAKLTAWAREEQAEKKPAKDTLVIRAESDVAEGPHTYAWRINGSVLRKLYNSDIAYLALGAGDAMLSLPTIGFTAGTKYAELKMGGVSTAEFEYEIVMNIDPEAPQNPEEAGWNRSADCAVALSVSVAGERYEMIDRAATPEMYPYDVYCGPEDLPDYPYGAYPGWETED